MTGPVGTAAAGRPDDQSDDRPTAGLPAVLSLGANLGDRLAALQGGLDTLRSQIAIVAVSTVYETAPVGGPPQPDYLNVIAFARVPSPAAALAAAHEAETAAGRTRTVRFGPRTLDVDIISVDTLTSEDPTLTLPHPRAAERAFVLTPWLELDPQATLPGLGPVTALLAQLTGHPTTTGAATAVRARPDLVLT